MAAEPIHSDEALTERDRELRSKDDLLEAVMAISRQLLEATDALVVMPAVLRRLGEAACIHRATLFFERDSPDGETFHEVVAEWCAEGDDHPRGNWVDAHPELQGAELRPATAKS